MYEPDITRLLAATSRGDAAAANDLYQLVYAEIRQLATLQMKHERADHTLEATALANEAYLRLLRTKAPSWPDRRYFFASVGLAMRRILIEHARRRRQNVRLGTAVALLTEPDTAPEVDWEAIDRALEDLAAEDQRLVDVVHLRYFAGLSRADTAAALEVSESTVKRDWAYARARLLRAIEKD